MSETIDAIGIAILRQLLEAAAEEMGAVLQRTAVSANIKERRDFSCALFDPRGRLLAQAAHVPVHLGSMGDAVGAVLEALGPLSPGSATMVNDPYAGGTHLPDLTVVSAVFDDEGRLLGHVASRAHHADVGGKTPGSMGLNSHIDDEGVRIAPMEYEAAAQLVFRGSRNPLERAADLSAQRLANDAGAAALQRISMSDGAADALLDYAAARSSEVLHRLPAGDYEAEDFMDDDGTGEPYAAAPAIRMILRLNDGRIVADFRASDPQVRGCVNCPPAVTKAAVYYVVSCLLRALGDGDVPLNDGSFRDVEVLTTPGTIVHAIHPAAVAAGNTEASQRIVDVLFAAFAQALPDLIPAQSCGTMSSVALGGSNWTYYETIGGGSGAGPRGEGESAVQCHMTNTLNTPAEALEMQYPLRVRRYAVREGSGGTGPHGGGDGIIREIEFLEAGEGTLLTDRRRLAPHGLAGGGDGQLGRNTLNGHDLGGKAHLTFKPGDVLTIQTPGGGGWGQ